MSLFGSAGCAVHLFLSCFGGPLDRVLLTFWRMHTHRAQRLPDRDERTTILRLCVEHVFGSWRQRALLPQMFVSNKQPRVLTSYTSPGLDMQKKSSIDCLSSSTHWSSRHLLKPLTRPAQSDMPQLRLCQCRMSMFTTRRFPGRSDSQHVVVTRWRRGGSHFLVAPVVFSGSPAMASRSCRQFLVYIVSVIARPHCRM